MFKVLKQLVFCSLIACISCAGVNAYAAEANAPTMKERVQRLQQNEAVKQLNFAFYLDSEGHANFEQKTLDEIVASIQAKMPYYAAVKGDGQFLADLDLYRESKYDELMQKMQETKPEFAVLGNYDESGKKIKLTKAVLDEYFADSEYDGLVLARIDVAQVKNSWNMWVGGIDTKAELDVTIRIYNKNSDKGYVFNNKQRVVGKSHAMPGDSTQRAARKAIPQALKNIEKITVE